ncbi:MAG: hypothetical protein AAFR04_08445 [Pseudomonadota bacterium]
MPRTSFTQILALAVVAAASLAMASLFTAQPAEAGGKKRYHGGYFGSGGYAARRSRAYRLGGRAPQVRGFVRRRGGYSYTYDDAINTTVNNRTTYGSPGVYRDPRLDTQSRAGPFDHGFFFDSGIAPRGGNSAYIN